MKRILIRPNEIANCWETKDACIVETTRGKKWVCSKTLKEDGVFDWNTLVYIEEHQNKDFITLELLEKGKSEQHG